MEKPLPALPKAVPALTPSPSLLSNFRQELLPFPPFAQMRAPEVDYFLAHCKQLYFAPDEPVIGPADGPVKTLYFIRKGAVTGTRGAGRTNGRF